MFAGPEGMDLTERQAYFGLNAAMLLAHQTASDAGCKAAEPESPVTTETFAGETRGDAWVLARAAGWQVIRDDVICPACAKAGHKPNRGRVAA